MIRYLVISIFVLASCSGNNRNPATEHKLPASLVNNPHTASGMDTVAEGRKPVMTFTDTMHDFGNIHEDEKVEYDFAFTNTGMAPLIISEAEVSCGCTVPDYSRDPVAPGKSGVIKVSFNSAGKSGHQEKSVSLHTNSKRGIQMLYIKSDIIKK